MAIVTGDTPQAVAYALMLDIRQIEQSEADSRDWVLSTYRECLRVAQGMTPG